MNLSGVTSTEKDNNLQCENTLNQTTNNLEKDDMHKNADKENVLLNQSSNEEYIIVEQYNLRSNLKRKQLENSDTEFPQTKLLKIDTDGTDFSRVKNECSSTKLQQNDDQKLEKVTHVNQLSGENNDYHKKSNIDSDIPEGLKEDLQVFNKTDNVASSIKEEISSDIGKKSPLNTGYIKDTAPIVVGDPEELAGGEITVENSYTDSGSIAVTRTDVHIHTRHRKLYRLLKEGEDITRGLEAKGPNSTITVADHVAFGSNGRSSKYISTCSNLSDAQKLRRLKTIPRKYRNGRTDIVEIDTSKLPLNVKIIDLTELHLRQEYEIGHGETTITRFHKHAAEFSEVLLEGKVPSECLTMT